jgi:succinate dehydrogenase / fumarate reductase flavoprotein subunit
VSPGGRAVYLDFAEAVQRLGREGLHERYGNVLHMYQQITGDDPTRVPMRIYPAAHYSMGGLWVDYDLMTTLPGLFAIGEANFSDHGANRLGASAMMQCLADGYFVVPYTVAGYLASHTLEPISSAAVEVRAVESQVRARVDALLSRRGRRTAGQFHAALGQLLWEGCGLVRSASGLREARSAIEVLQAQFNDDLCVGGAALDVNQELERAARVADYFELAKLMCTDALQREESCGCHFRTEYQTTEGEAARDDARFAHVALFEHRGDGVARTRREPLTFEALAPSERNYR